MNSVLTELAAGKPPKDIELRNVDVKEEPGRRRGAGTVRPGREENEDAATMLARELVCMSNTPDGGAIIVGIADDGQKIGTNLNPEWLRHRIYQLTGRIMWRVADNCVEIDAASWN